jgi:hypothetical protein
MRLDRPISRTEGLLTEEVDGELLAYDWGTNTAWRLNSTAAIVWRSCDGTRTLEDLLEVLEAELGSEVDEDVILIALDELVEHGMIESGYERRDEVSVRLSRRRFFKGATAATVAVAVPVVYSMAVPSAAAAASYPK